MAYVIIGSDRKGEQARTLLSNRGLYNTLLNLINPNPNQETHKLVWRLMASWGMGNAEPFTDEEKYDLLNKMRFGKGSKKSRYGDARWGPLAREEALLYDFGLENYIPPEVLLLSDFMQKAGLRFALHRKPVTFGCEQAVKYRVDALTGKVGVGVNEEIKAILFKGVNKKGEPLYIAAHTWGHYCIDIDIIRQASAEYGFSDVIFPDMEGKKYVDYAAANNLRLTTGRLNLVSLNESAKAMGVKLVQIVDDKLLTNQPGFTNAGRCTWGAQFFDVRAFIKAVQENALKIVNDLGDMVSNVVIAPAISQNLPVDPVLEGQAAIAGGKGCSV